MMIYKAFALVIYKIRFDDIHAFGVIGTLQFKQKRQKYLFYRPFTNKKVTFYGGWH